MKYKIRKIEKRYKKDLKNSEEKIILLEKSLAQLGTLYDIIWSEKDENSFKLRSFNHRLSLTRWKKIIANKFVKLAFVLFVLTIPFIWYYEHPVTMYNSEIKLYSLLIGLLITFLIAYDRFSIYLIIKQKFKRENVYKNSFLKVFLLYFLEIIKYFILPFLKKIIAIIITSSVASISFCGIFLVYMNASFWDELTKLDYSNLSDLLYIMEESLGLEENLAILILIVTILSIISLLALIFSISRALRFYHIKWKYLNISHVMTIFVQLIFFIGSFIILALSKYKNNLILPSLSFSIYLIVICTTAIIFGDELSVEKKFRRKHRDLLQAFLKNK